MCTRFKQALEKLDIHKKIEYVSLHEDALYETFSTLSKEECNETIHLITEQDEILIGARAIEHLATLFPGVNKLSWLLEKESSKKAMDFFYSKLQELRKNSKNCKSCQKD